MSNVNEIVDGAVLEAVIDGVGTGRYYRYAANGIEYSDDLIEWKESTAQLAMFEQGTWKIVKN